MVELDGRAYEVATPEENVQALVTFINDYCAEKGIRNSKGEIIFIETNYTNPLYMICFGISYLFSIVQKLVYNVGCAFNIASSSDRQLLELATIAKIKRKDATYTTISAIVYSESNKECVIDVTDAATVTLNSQSIAFYPVSKATIAPDSAATIILRAGVLGAYSLEAGAISSFDRPVDGLRQIVSSASIPGQDQETIASLRSRMQMFGQAGTRADRTAEAIRGLEGVSRCHVYFNTSNTEPQYISGIAVAPRTALIIVQGWSDKIAETFYSHMECLTQKGPASRNHTSTYVGKANQAFVVNAVSPMMVASSIRIYIRDTISTSEEQAIRDEVLKIGAELNIGDPLTSAQVISKVTSAFPNMYVKGATIAKNSEVPSGDEAWQMFIDVDQDSLITLVSTDITIITGDLTA